MSIDTSSVHGSLPAETKGHDSGKVHRRSGFWQLLAMLRPYYWLMGLTLGSGILSQGLTIACSAIGAYLVGAAVTGAGVDELASGLWILGGLVIARAVMAWGEMWVAHDLAYRLLADIRGRLYWALERLAPGYLLERRSGDLAAATMADVETLEWFFAHTVGAFVVAGIVSLATLFVLAWIHPLLPLVLLPWVVLLATVPFWLSKRASSQGKALREQLGEINADVVDGVQGLRELLIFGRGQAHLEKLDRGSRKLLQAQLAHGRRAGLETAIADVLISLGMLSVLGCAAWLSASGALSAAFFPMSIIIAVAIFRPIIAVTNVAKDLNVTFASAGRVFALLEERAPVEDRVQSPPAGPIEPRFAFEQVGFRYGEHLPFVLSDVSFEVTPGEAVALVGHSGAGKSTATHLLLRLWDVTQGRITIGGHDLRAFPQEDLRRMIALVPQDMYLFNSSLRENIRLGKPDATDVEVEEAARLALAHEFITTLPQGYETAAGERGMHLSGGQRQRIAIARAFLKDAPFLVMDEAVSNLDTENEQALHKAMTNLRAGRTTLVIAHRLSTIRTADRIIVLAGGRVAEIGTHEDLLRRQGVYASLIASQHDGLLI